MTRLTGWWHSLAFTLGVALAVAWGTGDEGWLFSSAVVGSAVLGLGVIYWLFPRGLHFAVGTATGLALYTSLFVVLGRAQFPDAPDWTRPVAFLLPVLVVVATAWLRRATLAGVVERLAARDLEKMPHTAHWLIFSVLIGAACFVLPINRLPGSSQGLALLGAMGAVAAIVAVSVRDVLRLLLDVALIMAEVGDRMRHLVVPASAFLLLYSLLVIGFATAYRVADALSLDPLFHGPDGPIRVSYPDALHFSVATISTVGYGDIQPRDDGIRVLASLEVVAGQLLLLFGVAEILRTRRGRPGDPEGD